jgi:hypothetical protein
MNNLGMAGAGLENGQMVAVVVAGGELPAVLNASFIFFSFGKGPLRICVSQLDCHLGFSLAVLLDKYNATPSYLLL